MSAGKRVMCEAQQHDTRCFDVNCNGCGSLIRNSGMMHAAIRQLTN